MKRFKLTAYALTIVIALASTTLAGNIGGMRTDTAETTTGITSDAAGNIGGLRSEEEITTDLSVAIAGNIGGVYSLILGVSIIP